MKISTAPELMEMLANVAAEQQNFCRHFAGLVEQEGQEEVYKQMQVENPVWSRKILDRVLELGRSPTSRPSNEYLSLSMDILEAERIHPKNQ